MKIAKTQLTAQQFSSLEQDILKTLRDIRNGIVHAQGSDSAKHGKAGEVAVSRLFNFRNEDGSLYEQNGKGCDVPKSVVERSNLPKELHCDVEIKYYDKHSSGSRLGDAVTKIQKIKNGLVLIKLFYDGIPEKPLNEIIVEKIYTTPKDEKNLDQMEKIANFVKNHSNPIELTRKKVKQFNAKCKNTRFYLNNTSSSNGKGRQVQLVDRWS